MLLWGIFAVWNVIVALVYGIDKFKAKRDSQRISERRLVGLALCFGALGALCGMHLFHHKTKKPKFKFGVPCLFVLNVAMVWCVWHFFG